MSQVFEDKSLTIRINNSSLITQKIKVSLQTTQGSFRHISDIFQIINDRKSSIVFEINEDFTYLDFEMQFVKLQLNDLKINFLKNDPIDFVMTLKNFSKVLLEKNVKIEVNQPRFKDFIDLIAIFLFIFFILMITLVLKCKKNIYDSQFHQPDTIQNEYQL